MMCRRPILPIFILLSFSPILIKATGNSANFPENQHGNDDGEEDENSKDWQELLNPLLFKNFAEHSLELQQFDDGLEHYPPLPHPPSHLLPQQNPSHPPPPLPQQYSFQFGHHQNQHEYFPQAGGIHSLPGSTHMAVDVVGQPSGSVAKRKQIKEKMRRDLKNEKLKELGEMLEKICPNLIELEKRENGFRGEIKEEEEDRSTKVSAHSKEGQIVRARQCILAMEKHLLWEIENSPGNFQHIGEEIVLNARQNQAVLKMYKLPKIEGKRRRRKRNVSSKMAERKRRKKLKNTTRVLFSTVPKFMQIEMDDFPEKTILENVRIYMEMLFGFIEPQLRHLLPASMKLKRKGQWKDEAEEEEESKNGGKKKQKMWKQK